MMPRRPGNEETMPAIQAQKRPKLAYHPAFVITKDTPKGQVAGAKIFNEMRERLLELGEMEEK